MRPLRSLFATILTALLAVEAWGQVPTGPGGVGNSTTNVLWLSGDFGVYSNAGTMPAANGNDVQQWNDRSGNGRHATQATLSLRPNYTTGVLNGRPILRFTAANGDRILSTGVGTGNAASIWAVASYSSLPSQNPGIIQASPAGSAFSSTTNEKVIGMWISSANTQPWGRGVQSNNTQRDITQTTNTSANTHYIIHNLYGGGAITQYLNNATAGTISYDNTLRSWSDFGIGMQAGEGWNGDIAEIIAYNQQVNAAQRIIISNYLAAKYDRTLGANDVYTMDNSGNGNFDYEVAGIGRVDASNIHNDAQGSGIVRVLNPTNLDDNEFFMWGHDNGALTTSVTTGLPAMVNSRLARLWRVSETANVGAITIRFDLTGLADFAGIPNCDVALSLRLLVDTNNSNLFSDETPIQGATHVSGNIYEFTNVTAIDNGDRFTLAVYNHPANDGPGGIGGAAMWWRADAGVTASSGLISTWADQSGNGRNLTSSGAQRPTLTTSATMNGQAVVRYGGTHYFGSGFSGPPSNNFTLMLAANGTSYQSLFRFQNTSSPYVVYPWENGGGRTFILSSDGALSGVNSGLVNGVNNVGGARYRINTTNGMQTYLNGGVHEQRNSVNNAVPSQQFYSGVYIPNGNESPICDVGEMVAYYSALNDAQMIILQNYLAAKYNVALTSNDTYTGDNSGLDFDFDVAGIGRVNSTNIHNDSKGTGIVRMFNPSSLGDDEFLIWGHNNGTLSILNTSDLPPSPSGVQGRLNRVWRVSETNAAGTGTTQDVGNVDIQFNLSSLLQPITASDLRLIIDHDGDGIFNEAGTLSIGGAQALACDNYLFAAVSGLTNGARFTIGTINISQTPLPVTFISFTGFISEGDAHLKWSTASELNNDHFTVERSLNGKNFTAVGQVDGSGTTQLREDYIFVDEFVPYGRIYYRIRQTDFDGATSYGDVITLVNTAPRVELVAVPNPTTAAQGVRIRVASDVSHDLSDAVVSVTDLTGKIVSVRTEVDASGQINVTFNDSLPGGIYIVAVRSRGLPQMFTRMSIVR